jgi:hypothetical protein
MAKTSSLFGGLDSALLDKRKFTVSKEDLNNVSCFFRLGKILTYDNGKKY